MLLAISDTSVPEIEEKFREFIKRGDIAIILINQNVSTGTGFPFQNNPKNPHSSHKMDLDILIDLEEKNLSYSQNTQN